MIAQIILSLATLVTSVTGFYAVWRQGKSTHKLVNGINADQVNRIDQLTATLTSEDITIPPHETVT